MSFTNLQAKAARALLECSLEDVSKGSGINKDLISRFERGDGNLSEGNRVKLVAFFMSHGIDFLDNQGVAFKPEQTVLKMTGKEGLITLMNDTYEIARKVGGEICLYNAKPENWLKYLTVDWFKMHADRMAEVQDNFRMRILAEEGNTQLISSFYAIYRWFPKDLFISEHESLYVYGDKLGFLTFGENDVEVLILTNNKFAAGVRALFNVAWEHVGIMPPMGEKLKKVDFSPWEKG